MKPWDIKSTNNKKPSDAFMLPLWAGFRPHNFYFAIKEIDGVVVVFIVPREYFDKEGLMYDDSMPIVQYLPDYLIETLEGVYEVEGVPFDRVKRDMITRGFNHGHFFQNFIDRSNAKEILP
jgi:hypothetical protein